MRITSINYTPQLYSLYFLQLERPCHINTWLYYIYYYLKRLYFPHEKGCYFFNSKIIYVIIKLFVYHYPPPHIINVSLLAPTACKLSRITFSNIEILVAFVLADRNRCQRTQYIIYYIGYYHSFPILDSERSDKCIVFKMICIFVFLMY